MTMTPENAMLSPDRLPDPAVFQAAHDDYAVVRRAIAYISEKWRAQPEVEQIAHAAGVTPDELHHLFRRWAGLTPKASPARPRGVAITSAMPNGEGWKP